MGIPRKQRGGAHQDARKAVTALRRLLANERSLQRMWALAGAQPLHRGDRLAGRRPQWGVAGCDGLSVDQHVAGSTLIRATPEPRPFQAELIAEGIEQWTVLVSAHSAIGAVD